MNLPRSTYYHQSKNSSGDDLKLIAQLESIIEDFPGYGYRRVTYELHRRNIPVNHKKVLLIMRQQGLLRKTKRCWIRTTDSNHSQRIYPNLTANLIITAPNQVWAADITYIGIQNGVVCLAVILDLFARRAIGHSISRNIHTALCLAALNMAIVNRNHPKGVIHHSDRGVQYASHDYVKALLQYGFLISMSRKGNPYDNAKAESFFKTIKVEEVYLWGYRTDLRRNLKNWFLKTINPGQLP
jgi:putative transposase